MPKTYQVYHILVQYSHEAEDILKKMDEGISFSELAKKYSICSSAKNKGDLGEIPIGKADTDFEEAALLLKPGQTTKKPIRTRFGFHLIKRLK